LKAEAAKIAEKVKAEGGIPYENYCLYIVLF